MRGLESRAPEAGASLVEVIIAITIFAIAVLGMVQMSVVTRQQAQRGEVSTEVWAAAQYQFEVLRGLPFDSVLTGKDTVNGYSLDWVVTGTNPKTVSLAIPYTSLSGGVAADTFVTQIANWAGS